MIISPPNAPMNFGKTETFIEYSPPRISQFYELIKCLRGLVVEEYMAQQQKHTIVSIHMRQP